MIKDKDISAFFSHLNVLRLEREKSIIDSDVVVGDKSTLRISSFDNYKRLNDSTDVNQYLSDQRISDRYQDVEYKIMDMVNTYQDLELKAAKFESFYAQALAQIKKQERYQSELINRIAALTK